MMMWSPHLELDILECETLLQKKKKKKLVEVMEFQLSNLIS